MKNIVVSLLVSLSALSAVAADTSTPLLVMKDLGGSSRPVPGGLNSVEVLHDGTVVAHYNGSSIAAPDVQMVIASVNVDQLQNLVSKIEVMVPSKLVNPHPSPVSCLACHGYSFTGFKADGTSVELAKTDGRGSAVRKDGLGADGITILNGFWELAHN